MFSAVKVFLFFMTGALVWAETAKRELISPHVGLEFLHLGGFGPVSRLSSHPTFAHLGLTTQQIVGFTNILLQNGFLNPYVLRQANGLPFIEELQNAKLLPGQYYGFPNPLVDPYIFYLFSNYARYLPYGLGPQGFFGSTGLPRPRLVGPFKHADKN